MKFARIAIADAQSAILAHSVSVGCIRLHKGIFLTSAHIEMLQRAEIFHVWAAMPEANEITENDVAVQIARILLPEQELEIKKANVRAGVASAGRCNIYATAPGLCSFSAESVHKLNQLSENITLATVSPLSQVTAGQIIATVKIIPFAVRADIVDQALHCAADINLAVSAFTHKTASLIMTRLAGMKENLFNKAAAVTSQRLGGLNITMSERHIVAHDVDAVSDTLRRTNTDITLVLGASAIADRADIIPAAIEKSGSMIVRMGMPVDPGNLLCFAMSSTGKPIIGLPGCARSPKFNGLDIILQRLAANLLVTATDIAQMGVGGLLDDVSERGHLREARSVPEQPHAMKIGALVLAAGQSSRMGAHNKLLLDDGQGPVITKVINTLKHSNLHDIIVVTGYHAETLSALVAPVPTVHNPDYRDGLSSSLRAGLAHVPDDWDGALIVLADMPEIHPDTIRSICAAAVSSAHDAVVPVFGDKQGNPVLWKRPAFPLLRQAQADTGGKAQLAHMAERVLKLHVTDPAVLMDIDTPHAWQEYRSRLKS
jgi:molybdenum cofactor cytidylyltransferase